MIEKYISFHFQFLLHDFIPSYMIQISTIELRYLDPNMVIMIFYCEINHYLIYFHNFQNYSFIFINRLIKSKKYLT